MVIGPRMDKSGWRVGVLIALVVFGVVTVYLCTRPRTVLLVDDGFWCQAGDYLIVDGRNGRVRACQSPGGGRYPVW